MTRALERLLRLQRGDLPRGLWLFAHLFLVMRAFLVGQVAPTGAFLGRFSAALLPLADIALFLSVAVVVGLYVRAGRRLTLDRLIIWQPAGVRRDHPGVRVSRPRRRSRVALSRRLRLGGCPPAR